MRSAQDISSLPDVHAKREPILDRPLPMGAVLVFADESAAWKLAGLRQIDRLLLALNDCAARSGNPKSIPVHVCSLTPQSFSMATSRLPHLRICPRLEQFLALTQTANIAAVDTRVVAGRNAFA